MFFLSIYRYRCIDQGGLFSPILTRYVQVDCALGRVTNVWDPEAGNVCDMCPYGGLCSEKGQEPVKPLIGFWETSDEVLWECVPPEACTLVPNEGPRAQTKYLLGSLTLAGCSEGYVEPLVPLQICHFKQNSL